MQNLYLHTSMRTSSRGFGRLHAVLDPPATGYLSLPTRARWRPRLLPIQRSHGRSHPPGRFMTEEQYGWRVEAACPRAVRILDTEDLHCLRYGAARGNQHRARVWVWVSVQVSMVPNQPKGPSAQSASTPVRRGRGNGAACPARFALHARHPPQVRSA